MNNDRHNLSNQMDWSQKEPENENFSIYIDGQQVVRQTKGVLLKDVIETGLKKGAEQYTVQFDYAPSSLLIECHTIVYPNTDLLEKWVTVRNNGTQAICVERLDSIFFKVPEDDYELMYYTSAWGQEFEPVRKMLSGNKMIETRKGRSSSDIHPWFTLFRRNGELITGSAMWSGNWVFRFDSLFDGGYEISGGLNDWEFFKEIQPNESMAGIHVAMALGRDHDLNTTSVPFASVGRTHWYPQNDFSQSLPIEWNHWWSYEDKYINEIVFKENVDVSAKLGMDICTLDAGWFGPTIPETHWYDYRGDWDLVNTSRFPSGIRVLSDYVHDKGMKFGLWCEIEALGQYAKLAETHPRFVALRDIKRLGYVCFGNPEVQDWACQTLDRLITEYRCEWIKLDFNLDPGAGCNRTDHGHGAGDGLYEHYQGYYKTLERIREKHPNVILENCSSGGLRIDLGILTQTHTSFLSDPDWPEHNLQLFWGASTMMASDVCLHWGYSEWIGDHKHQKFNPRDPHLKQHELDYNVRISMLGGIGFSQRFPELPDWVADRIAYHSKMYKEQISRFVRSADLYRLTDQPKRDGKGDRWAGYQYSLSEDGDHLLFVFRLHGSENERKIPLKNLEAEQKYKLTWLSEDRIEYKMGSELMDSGLKLTQLVEEDSSIIHIN